ncbi:MAG: CoA-binding protein [Thermodesulfobacteriota bacterium]|nr:CoA-binding protein [Thermodesulfobacteriota bacterium]
MQKNPLHELMNPKSIAFMGASKNISRMGSFLMINTIAGKFEGPIYPVHPKEETVLGLKAYKRLKDLPEVPGLLVLVIPTQLVPEILEEAGEMGIRYAVIVTAGYDEIGTSQGRALQEKIDRIVEKYGIRYVGANCIGVYNSFAKLNPTPFPNRLPPGKVGMISHSGTYLSHLFPHLESLDFNFGEGISIGNGTSIDTVDALEYFSERDEIEVIGMYLEGLKRADCFLNAACRISKKKPLVALYTGGTEGGARSASTHTAAMSGSDAVFNAAFQQAGIIRAWSIEELLDYTWAFATQPLPQGDKMAVITVSGGPGTSMADSIFRCGLKLPEFPSDMRKEIDKHLPHTGCSINPVDITFSMNQEAFFRHIPEIVLKSDLVDGVFIYGILGSDMMMELNELMGGTLFQGDISMIQEMNISAAKEFVKFVSGFGKPVLGSSFQAHLDSMVKTVRREGIPIYTASERAVKAMAALYQYKKYRDSRVNT